MNSEKNELIEILDVAANRTEPPSFITRILLWGIGFFPFLAISFIILVVFRGFESIQDIFDLSFVISEPEIIFLACFSFGLSLLYSWWVRPVSSINPKLLFQPESENFNALRRKTFPPPYPNGWYLLASSSTLVAGAPPKSFSICGIELIAFRGNDGQVGVLDAFCPHLGAHLGIESRVVGNCVQCPFHQWEFNKDGLCERIPYLDSVPASAKTRAYPTLENIDCVFFWFDAEHRPPSWDPTIPARLQDGSMYFGGVTQLQFKMHIAEMAENSADPFHFNTLHAPFPLPILNKLIQLRHRVVLDFPNGKPEASHICLFREYATPYLFGAIPFTAEQVTNLYFDGPSFVHFMLSTPFGRVHLFKSAIPIAPLNTITEDRWYADHSVPRWFGWMLAKIARGALEQDRSVWEHKVYQSKPGLMKGERDFHRHRRWYRQFYSEHSVSFNNPQPIQKSSLDW